MNIDIRVIANAKKREITREGQTLKVKLLSVPTEGRANEELVEYLAKILKVKRSEVRIVRGQKERNKVVSIPVDEETLKVTITEKA